MRRPVIAGVVSEHVVVIGMDGVTAAIRRFIGGWNDRCEPFTWTKPVISSPILGVFAVNAAGHGPIT